MAETIEEGLNELVTRAEKYWREHAAWIKAQWLFLERETQSNPEAGGSLVAYALQQREKWDQELRGQFQYDFASGIHLGNQAFRPSCIQEYDRLWFALGERAVWEGACQSALLAAERALNQGLNPYYEAARHLLIVLENRIEIDSANLGSSIPFYQLACSIRLAGYASAGIQQSRHQTLNKEEQLLQSAQMAWEDYSHLSREELLHQMQKRSRRRAKNRRQDSYDYAAEYRTIADKYLAAISGSNKWRTEEPLGNTIPAPNLPLDEQLLLVERVREAESAGLSKQELQIFKLKEIDMKEEDIASILDVHKGHVASAWSRARRKIRQAEKRLEDTG